MQVELEGIRDESAPHPDPGLALVVKPPVGTQQIVHEPVKVLVVAELDMAAQVPGEAVLVEHGRRQPARVLLCFAQKPVAVAEAIEAPRCAEPCRARAHDEDTHPLHHWGAGPQADDGSVSVS